MSTSNELSLSFPQRPASATLRAGLVAALSAGIRTLRVWRARGRQRQHLAALPAHVLKDIGLSDADAWAEAYTPFWREGFRPGREET